MIPEYEKTVLILLELHHTQMCGAVINTKMQNALFLTSKLIHSITTETFFNILLRNYGSVVTSEHSEQDNVRTNTESVQCHHVFDIAYLAPTLPTLPGHMTSSIT